MTVQTIDPEAQMMKFQFAYADRDYKQVAERVTELNDRTVKGADKIDNVHLFSVRN